MALYNEEEEKSKAGQSKKTKESQELAAVLQALAGAQNIGGASRDNAPMGQDFASRATFLGAQGQAAVGQGAAMGAATGAQVGTALGGPGIGTAVGAGLGVLQGMGKRKQAKRAIKAAAVQEKGRIEKEKEDKTAEVLGSIIANLRTAMIR